MFAPRFVQIVTVLLLCTVPAAAQQIPEGTVGIGATVGSMNSRNDILGGHLALVPSANLHVGAQAGFALESGRGVGSSRSYWLLAPYAKLLFPLRDEFTPFLIGQMILDNGGSTYTYTPGQGETTSSLRTSLFIGGGAEYFPSSRLGIYAYLGLLDIGLEPQATRIGLLQPRAGIEWFFH